MIIINAKLLILTIGNNRMLNAIMILLNVLQIMFKMIIMSIFAFL